MFTRILVPLDGSPRAETALPVAARIAQAAGGSVILVQVVSIPSESLGPFASMDVDPTLLENEQQEAKNYLTHIAGQSLFAGCHIETSVLAGPVAPLLVEEIARQRANLVTLSSHGRTGFTRWMLGSVAQHLARHAPAPVLVLRDEGSHLSHGQAELPLWVLVPVDGSEISEVASRPAAWLASALASPQQPEVHLFSVVNAFEREARQQPQEVAIARAQLYLASLAKQVTAQQPSVLVTWSVAIDQDPAENIIVTAEQGEREQGPAFDLVAMATHGRTGFARWAMGSITERVLWSTRLPVLIVRPNKTTETRLAADTPEAESAIKDWPGLQ
jgi:nucleotide-binding universal stress UspA family protein